MSNENNRVMILTGIGAILYTSTAINRLISVPDEVLESPKEFSYISNTLGIERFFENTVCKADDEKDFNTKKCFMGSFMEINYIPYKIKYYMHNIDRVLGETVLDSFIKDAYDNGINKTEGSTTRFEWSFVYELISGKRLNDLTFLARDNKQHIIGNQLLKDLAAKYEVDELLETVISESTNME